MKNIEKRISPLIQSQFPSFYQEEGENFIAFVKAYYEWLENSGTYVNYSGNTVTQYIASNNDIIEVTADQLANSTYMSSITRYQPIDANPLYHGRRLPDYRDIDSTTDDFIVHFKEKYLKNIQFDTATNKKLLVKNSLDLYRAKGTERAVDLFFKLVYGTAAEVRYPAEKIFRLSDGVYEKPEYLEIGYSIYNVDYVGKQVVGQLSGAKAFVEKYIRRRAGKGFVNLLYISGRQGNFRNGEVIGLNINNQPIFDITKRSKLIGSVRRVTVQTRGRDFAVGDIVRFTNSDRGLGGLARVESISSQAGLVDFIFIDGGYGYTLDTESIVSEKVLNLNEVIVDFTSENYYRLFERGVQPVVNIGYSSASSNVAVGNTIYRYAANGMLAAEGRILEVATTSNTAGFISISHTSGVFVPSANYSTGSNSTNGITFTANTLTDKSMSGKFMNIPTDYAIVITAPSATFNVGDVVKQQNAGYITASGTVANVITLEGATQLTLTNARGAFKNSKRMADWDYKAGTGTITTTTTSNVVTGTSTAFNNNYINSTLYVTGNVAIGNVVSVTNSTSLILSANAAANATGNAHNYGLTYKLINQTNNQVFANVSYVNLNAGLYDIKKQVHVIEFDECSSNNVTFANNIYIYNSANVIVAEGSVITANYASASNTGTLTFVSRKGYWNETDTVYTTSTPPISVSFNANSSVTNATDEIAITSANTLFSVNDSVLYTVAAGNTALTNLVSGTRYFIKTSNSSAVTLSETVGGSTINLTKGLTEAGHSLNSADNFKITSYSLDITGGDYVRSFPSKIIAPLSNTTADITSISFGTGAGFGVGTIGETEVIFIGTDLIAANSQDTLDYSRLQLSVTANTGFDEGQRVYQQIRKVSFNPSTAANAATGFITITNANTYYVAGDRVTYEVAAGNTVISGLESGKPYYVAFSNTTGLILSSPANKYIHINSTSFPGESFADTSFNIPAFAATRANESGHFLYKTAHGTLYDVTGTNLLIKDPIRDFGFTNTTSTPSNSNIIVYGNNLVNTAITAVTELSTIAQANQVFASEFISSDAFGFPKNPQGNLLDNLYACLTFGRFEIGIIGSLNQINPGEDYNVDPFVLAHQPYVAGFDRKDFVITFENATRNFVVGEIVNQSQANLKFFDLQVSSGAYSNTYDAKTFTVQSQFEANNTSDFIFYRNITSSFNPTDEVNSNTDFITITGNEFVANDLVRYFTDTGNTAVTGLSNNSFYYVLTSNTTGVTLTTEAANTLAKVNITQSSNVAEFNSNTQVENSNDFIQIATANTLFANGSQVRYVVTAGVAAVDGLEANSLYYVRYANSTGLSLSVTAGGDIANLTAANPGGTGHFLRNYNPDLIGHQLRSYQNEFANGQIVQYRIPAGNTAIGGLASNGIYYVVSANNVGFKLSANLSGSVIDITANSTGGESHTIATLPGYLPKDKLFQNVVSTFNSNTQVQNSNDFILIASANSKFANGQQITYSTAAGNTAVTGLSNNSLYFIRYANSTGLALSATSTGANIDITATSVSETGHFLTANIVNVFVSSVFSNTIGNYIRVSGNTAPIVNNQIIFSYTVPTANGLVSNVSLFEIVSTAKAIVKSSNNSHMLAKRITFENTWLPSDTMIGEVSGSEANVIGVTEDLSVLYPIGLNAEITANVVTASGEVTALQVIDSGFAYSNAEIVDFVSEDNLRAGTAKMVLDGHGIGIGYYRSSKGFLSDDIYVHDNDYYQEYSYEILSKISVDRYSDMFKKVMHVAGTKFFGSALIVEEANAALALTSISTAQEVQFNSNDDVSTANDTIETDIEDVSFKFKVMDINNDTDLISLVTNPYYTTLPLNVNDYLQYTTLEANVIGVGTSSNLSNNAYYYVVLANTTGIKISETQGGDALNLNTVSMGNTLALHTLTKVINPFANGDLVLYTTSNVAVEASITGTFTTNTGAAVDSFIKVANNKFRNSDYVNVTFDSTTCNTQSFNANTAVDVDSANAANVFITISSHPFANDQSVLYYTDAGNTAISGLTNNQIYYVIQTTTNTLKLATQSGNTQSIANIMASAVSESGHNIMRGFNGITNATSYYVMDANTTGFKLSTTGARTNIINFKSSNTGLTLNLSQNKLTNAQSYYVVNTTPNTVKLSLTANGSPINITANGSTAGSINAGHFLTKTIEE
jgi:hypothetical protein